MLEVARSVLLVGPRQVGKSTMAGSVVRDLGGSIRRLDDPATAAFARSDPIGFLREGSRPVLLDEVQLVPELYRAIKHEIDLSDAVGQFLLAGSARLGSLPDLADALVGRADVLELAPLSRRELSGRPGTAIDVLFSDVDLLAKRPITEVTAHDLLEGGFPELRSRRTWRAKASWIDAYLSTVAVRTADPTEQGSVQSLLRGVAATRGLFIEEHLAGDLGMPATTMRRYLNQLDAAYLIERLRGWAPTELARARKRGRVHLVDAAITARLLDLDPTSLASDRGAFGHLFETFVVTELRRQRTVSEIHPQLMHVRVAERHEVDLVLEHPSKGVVAIEIKSTRTPRAADAAGLVYLRDRLGERFRAGVLIHLGDSNGSLGDRITALHASCLWT